MGTVLHTFYHYSSSIHASTCSCDPAKNHRRTLGLHALLTYVVLVPRAPGFKALPPVAQADVRRRLHRCGLAASLDRTLRLVYSAEDTGQSGAASDLQRLEQPVAELLGLHVVPIFAPCATAKRSSNEAGSSKSATNGAHGRDSPAAGLGLLLTLSKRAAKLGPEVENAAGSAADACAQLHGNRKERMWTPQQRRALMDSTTDTVVALAAAVQDVEGQVEGQVQQRAEAVRQGTAGGGGDAMLQLDAMCTDELHETLALAARAVSTLAAPLAAGLAAEVAAAAVEAGGPGSPLSAVHLRAVGAVCGVLGCAARWWGCPQLLPPAQLLACQPHRLLAAACALAAVLEPALSEDTAWVKKVLCERMARLVVAMASHGTLSGRVRGWLAPPPPAAGPSGGEGGGGAAHTQQDVCAGCLAEPLYFAMRHGVSLVPLYAPGIIALLCIAAGVYRFCLFEAAPEDFSCAGLEEQPDGGFMRYAMVLAGLVDPSLADKVYLVHRDGYAIRTST